MSTGVLHVQKGGAVKRKASAMETNYQPPAAPQQAGESRSQTRGRSEDAIVIPGEEVFSEHEDSPDRKEVVPDDSDFEILLVFKYGAEKRRIMPKQGVLPFVRKQGEKIFLRQAAKTIDNKDEHGLEDVAYLITNAAKVDKATILSRYNLYWSEQLNKCVEAHSAEVKTQERMLQKLKWAAQVKSFNKTMLEPKRSDLKEAEYDARKMAALIKFLQDS